MRTPAPLRLLGSAWASWTDRVAGSDPGFNRLVLASRGALTISLALAGEWVFVRGTGALQVAVPPHPTAAQVASATLQHHDVLVVAMLLGGLVGLMTAMNVSDRTLVGQVVTLTYIPAAMIGALAIGLALGSDRPVALAVMVLVLTAGAYGRRFGPRGAPAGVLLFVGYFYGFFLSATLRVSAVGWLAAEVGVAVAAAVAVRLVVFRPSPEADLRRALRSYGARARRVTTLALGYLEVPDGRRLRALHRWLVRLDEAALIVEGQLDDPLPVPAGTALRLRQWLFDVELALTNAARFVEMLAGGERQASREEQRLARDALAALAAGDNAAAQHEVGHLRRAVATSTGRPSPVTSPRDETAPPEGRAGEGGHHQEGQGGSDGRVASGGGWRPAGAGEPPSSRVVLHRYADAIEVLAAALGEDPGDPEAIPTPAAAAFPAPPPRDPTALAGGSAAFRPAVTLRAGWLPGTADVSTEASTGPGVPVRLAPYVRTTAQMTVAASVAIVAGDALDAQRFYWAVVAALLVLVGTNTVAEQLRKAAYRIVGTLVGVVAGTALVDAVGTHSAWSLVVVVASVWVGMYLFRVNYAFMAMAITVSLSQAYLSLGEFSGGLLADRLAETALGAGAAMATVLVVVPLRTRRVLDVATADLVDAVVAVADAAVALVQPREARGPTAPGDDSPVAADGLRTAGRRVDAAYQALMATAQPLRMVSWADAQDRVARLVAAAAAARNYARNLVFDTEGAGPEGIDGGTLARARDVLDRSAGSLSSRLRGAGDDRVFTRAGALLGTVECAVVAADGPPSPTVLVLRDLALLDGALAAIARRAGMAVRTLDGGPAASNNDGPADRGPADPGGNGHGEECRPAPGRSEG